MVEARTCGTCRRRVENEARRLELGVREETKPKKVKKACNGTHDFVHTGGFSPPSGMGYVETRDRGVIYCRKCGEVRKL